MAILEISAARSITTFEVADGGYGVALQVEPVAPDNAFDVGWVGLWFGNRLLGEFPGKDEFIDDRRLRETAVQDKICLGIQQAISEVGEANCWSTVTLNGNTIWISEALRKAREELRKARAAEKKAAKADKAAGQEAEKSET